MNTATTILLPLFTASILLSTSAASVIADDLPLPKSLQTDAPAVAPTSQVRFIPVPYRRMNRSETPVRITTRQGVPAIRPNREPSRDWDLPPNGTMGVVKDAVLKRVADFRSSQTKDLLVPQPRDISPGSRPETSVERATVQLDTKAYVPASNVRTRKHINFHSTLGVRAFH